MYEVHSVLRARKLFNLGRVSLYSSGFLIHDVAQAGPKLVILLP
jgi:hypothetical protein